MKDGNDHYDLNLLVTKLNAIVDRAAKNDRRFLNVAAVAQRTSPSAESTRRPIS
jgi:CO dehydrogenase/acetyl-CoA synthase epsilon subunit